MQINFNTNRLDILPTDESYRYRSIMGEHTLTLYFLLPTYTDIPTGAWCEFQGERYTLNQPAKIVKHNSFSFEYTLTMDSEGANLKNYKFRNPNDKTLKFPFTASPRYHIQILVDCLNMIDSGWQVGNCIEASEKLVSYNHNNCLEALDMIAKAFETEYEIIGKTIHLHKVEYFKNNPLPLQYGKGKGFKTGVSRTTEQSHITRLYVQGGDRNIDRSKYGNKELLLPKSQEYTYEGVNFVSDDKGLSISIKNAQNNGFVNEQSLDLSHIYPKRKGTISAVFEVDKAKHFYDFTDTTIPQALNFSDLQIKGEKMVIYFESGMLSGREFGISRYEHSSGYNHSTRRFEIVPEEEDGTTMPNDIFKPAIGDEYSVYNMQMPNAYICDNATQSGASWEMMKEACKYLYENRADHFTFTGDLDGIWAKKHWANVGGRLKMGAYIHFSDTEFQRTPVAIRIVGLKEYVNNPYSPQIELSNKVQGQSFATEIRKLQNQEVYFGELNKRTLSETKRSWRNALETIKQVEEAFPEYTKSIIPATVQTMMALVGNKSGQFVFVSSKATPITVPHSLYFDKATKQLNAGSGWIKHYALGTTDIKPNYSAADYKYWYAPAFVSGRLDDKAKTYYLYIKASKVVETAQFVLSETKIDIEQEAGYYHFLYATVNSEYNGERGIAQLNGFTEITGGQIKTDKITSGNGQQYIELLDNEIRIKANLQITDGNKTEIKQLVNPDLLSLENKLKQYTNEQTSNIQVGGRNLLRESKDFSINASFAPYFMVRNWNGKGLEVVDEKFNGNVVRKITGEWQGIKTEAPDIIGEPVTISFWAKTNAWVKFINSANNSKNTNNIKDFTEYSNNGVLISDNLWHRYTIYNPKGMCLGNGVSVGFLEFYQYNGEVLVSSIKIEKGNKPTDWSPAPEDLEMQIQTEQQARQAAIAAAQTATKAYARTQTELTKAQAIAEANKQAGIAITAEQQARILQLQQNLQQAKTFAQQKVDELNVGGRNLLLKSQSFDDSNGWLYQNGHIVERNLQSYNGRNVATRIYLSGRNWDIHRPFTFTEDTEYTFSCWIKLETTTNAVFYLNNTQSWENPLAVLNVTGNLGEWKKVVITFRPQGNLKSNIHIGGNDRVTQGAGNILICDMKLEKGNKPTDWSPAPEDVWDTMVDLGIIDKNAMNLTEAEKANVKFINGMFSKGADYTNGTEIVKNTITTGALTVGNTLGGNAGINGAGLDGKSIRFFAGANYSDKERAPFRVQDDGSIYASKGQIGNFKIESASETSLKANGLTIASEGLIRAMGRGKDSRTTQVRINDPEIFKTVDKSAIDVFTSGFNDTTHSAMKLESRGGRKSTALILKAIWGQEESVALDIIEGDVKINGKTNFYGEIIMNGQKGHSGKVGIGSGYYLIITNGIVTNLIRE